MRLRNWLLTGTSLGLLAMAPIPAQAQSAELIAAYQAYVDATASGDAAATETALGALTEQCIVGGFANVEACIAAAAAALDGSAAAAAAAAAEQAAAEQAAAEQAAAEQAAAEQAAAAQAAADAEAAAAAQAAADAEATAAAQAAADAEAAAAAQSAADAEAAAAAQAAADAEAAAAAQAAADAEAAATAEQDAAAAQQAFVADLNAALGEYQSALDQAAGGDYDGAKPVADAAAARILELCTANGYPDIASCIGQELPALPQPEVQPELEAQPEPEAQPEAQPEPELPVEQPVEQPVAQPVDPVVQAQADLGTAVELYNVGISQLLAGDASGQSTVEVASQQITDICATVGYSDFAQCLAELGFEPLAPVPQVEIEPPAPAPLPETANEIVTPDAVEVLPEAIAPEEAAPILDSAKDVLTLEESGEPPVAVVAEEPVTPPPTTDADAQAQIAPVEIVSIEAEQGQQVAADALPPIVVPQNVTIIQNIVNNTVINNTTNNTTNNNNGPVTAPRPNTGFVFQIGLNIVINNPEQERDRLYDEDEDQIYYEELPRGRSRETIVRPNGVRIVTVRDRFGDVIKKSRFSPDGREYVLAYYDEDRNDRFDRDDDNYQWRDPGDDLPPLRLTIPARDYILDVEDAEEEEVELFFRQPPVEQVRRIYTIDEVKRSARVRDSVRRIEVGGLTFDSGKATIASSQVGALSKVARAMLAVLDDNPGETFLIEGHTDAVGSEISNLSLSDQRADVVAQILTDFYKVPPENLVTQGYGERYLKVKTEAGERLNRRVTIKRITSLVTVADLN